MEVARAAEDSRTLIACSRSRRIRELGLDIVVVFVAFEFGYEARLSCLHRALGMQLGAAVVIDGTVDNKVAGTVLLAMLAMEAAVGDRTRKCPLVGWHVTARIAGHSRGPCAVKVRSRSLCPQHWG